MTAVPKFKRSGTAMPAARKKPAKVAATADFTDAEFAELVEAARAEVPDIFIPVEGMDLSMVKDWIEMPAPLCEVMRTPGLPCGHILQVVGDSDTGKTTFSNHALIGAQKAGGVAILIDSEHKYSIERAVQMGLDRNKLLWVKVRTIEEAFDKIVKILRIVRDRNPLKKVVVVWDSVGGTPCEWEVSGTGLDGEDIDDKKTHKEYAPAAAKAIKGGLRKTRYFLQEMNAALILINQFYTRTDLKGPMAAFAKKKKAYGGEGPKYYSTIVLEFTRVGALKKKTKDGNIQYGITSKVECVKNHIAPPFSIVEVEIDAGGVIDGRAPIIPESFVKMLAAVGEAT